uniref:Putative tail protein n=1 Tax=viral metagenome TaxID=1070528 RepID=A0A6M3JXN7_9ZZZZ
MPIAVAGKNYTLISTCDLITSQGGWTGVDTADTVDKKQGASSLCGTLKAAGANNTTFIPTGSPTTKLDLSGEKHLRFWFLITSGGLVELYANGGIQFWASDGTNIGYWYVGGRDTYPGGWQNFVVDLTKGVDAGTKPPNMALITQIGTRHVLTLAGKNVDNVWIDHFCVCDGLVVSGDIDSGVITCGVDATEGTYTRSTGSFLTDGFRVGMDFTASGYTNSGNNATKTISAVIALVITVTDNTGLVTESGTADERIRGYVGLQDIFAVTNTPSTLHGIGVLTRKAGVYCLTGVLEVGLATSLTKFQMKSQAIVFEDRAGKAGIYSNIKSTLMKILITDSGNASYTTEFILGSKSGSAGIQGCIVRVESGLQIAKFSLDGSGANVDNFKLYGSTIYGASSIKFPATAANVEILSCSFELCGQVDPSSAPVSKCFFINTSSVDAALLWNESINIGTCSFIANAIGAGIQMPSAVGTPYAYNALLFSGNTYDVLNSSGSPISINKNNGSDPTSYEGSAVTFLGAAVTVTIHVDNHLGVDLQDAMVYLKASDGAGDLPFEDTVTQITRAGTLATVTHQTAHGLNNNEYVKLSGITDKVEDNWGAHQITWVSANSYTYITTDSGSVDYTGTIIATGVLIYGLTAANGNISASRTLTVDQNFTGYVRKSSASPRFKSFTLAGSIDSVIGATVNVRMILNE